MDYSYYVAVVLQWVMAAIEKLDRKVDVRFQPGSYINRGIEERR